MGLKVKVRVFIFFQFSSFALTFCKKKKRVFQLNIGVQKSLVSSISTCVICQLVGQAKLLWKSKQHTVGC